MYRPHSGWYKCWGFIFNYAYLLIVKFYFLLVQVIQFIHDIKHQAAILRIVKRLHVKCRLNMMIEVLNTATSDDSFSTIANRIKATVGNGLRKGFLSVFGFALILMLQVAFFSPEAIASPLAGLFGNKVDQMTQRVKTDMAIDKATGITKEVSRDIRDGKTDKVIDKIADTSKDLAKQAENRAKELAKNVKEGAKENTGKAKGVAKDAKDKIGNGVDKAKEMASDQTDEIKDGAKNLSEKAGNKVDQAIDSVKDFVKQ